MKKLISLLLVLAMLCGIIPINSISANAENNNEKYIYCSDLFYAYPNALYQDPFLHTYNTDFNTVCRIVYDNYNDSAAKVGTIMERTLEVVASPAELTKQITDTLGLTDFDKNKAYDTANKKLVSKLLNPSFENSLQSAYGQTGAIMNKTRTIVKLFETYEELWEGKKAEEYLLELADSISNIGITTNLPTDIIAEILEKLSDSGQTLSGIFGLAAREIDIAQAFTIALMMEDVRMEVINEIIASQTSNTILKEGMTRLKNQLFGGFITYFISNYIVEERIIGGVLRCIGNAAYTAIGIKTVCELLGLAEKIIFDIIIDVPSYGEVLAYQVLTSYSSDLYTAVRNKAQSFIDGPLVSNEVFKYQDLFSAYVAANSAALDIIAKIAPYEGAFELFREAVDEGIETVTINGEEYSSHLTETEINDALMDNLFTGNIILVINNGVRTKRINIKAVVSASLLMDSYSVSAEQIRALFSDVYDGLDIFESHIESAKNNVSGEPIVEWDYEINKNTVLRLQSDTIEANSIYTYDNKLLGNAVVKGDFNLTFPLEVLGNLSWENAVNSSFVINENITLNVNKTLTLTAGDPGYNKTSYSYFTVQPDAVLNVGKHFNSTGYKKIGDGVGYINTDLYGDTKIRGNFNVNNLTNTYIRGYVEINGNLNQISTTSALNTTTNKIWVCDNGNCLVQRDLNMKGAYYRNTQVNWSVFEVTGGTVNVCGNLNATDRFVAIRQNNENSVFVIWGNATVNALNSSSIAGFNTGLPAFKCNLTAGVLILYGNYTKTGGSTITSTGSHTIYLSGRVSQNISGLNFNHLIINNNTGTTFGSAIKVSGLFNHNEKPYSLYNNGVGSTFIDYDGDGLKDNIDLKPSINNPPGDNDFNGVVSSFDVEKIRKYILGLDGFRDIQFQISDTNSDSIIDIHDLVAADNNISN